MRCAITVQGQSGRQSRPNGVKATERGHSSYGDSVVFERAASQSFNSYHPVHPVHPCKLFLLGKVGTREQRPRLAGSVPATKMAIIRHHNTVAAASPIAIIMML